MASPSGQLYLEPAYIFGCLRDAARYTSRRRGTLQPILASTLEIEDRQILIDRWLPEKLEPFHNEAQLVYLDVRSVRNPSTRARNVRYRVAAASGWKASFTIQWENTLVSENEMQAVLRDAGQFVGLGDGRSVGLGRFRVQSFAMRNHAETPTTPGDLAANPAPHLAAGRKKMRALRRAPAP